MLKICDYPCNNRHELALKEREIIENLRCKLNKQVPTQTKNEWQNLPKNLIKQKEWRNLPENLIKKKENSKKYRDKNIELIKESNKIYRDNNKETNNKKIICDLCGVLFTARCKTRHESSTFHQQFIAK